MESTIPWFFWLFPIAFTALVVGAIPLLFRLGRSLERLVGGNRTASGASG